MEAKTEVKTFNVQDIERFLKLDPDDKILYIWAVYIKRCGNDPHKKMVKGWIENLDNDFQEFSKSIYEDKIIQLGRNWSNPKILNMKKDLEDLVNGHSDKRNGSLSELEVLLEAVRLFSLKNPILIKEFT